MQEADDESIYNLWDELSHFDAAQADKALEHFLGRLCRWTNAGDAFWIGAVRIQGGAHARTDPMRGWRARVISRLNSTADKSREKMGMRIVNGADPGETSMALVAQAGRFRVYSLEDGKLVDPAAFKRTGHYQRIYRERGISDRLWAVFPVNADTEAYYCIDKYGERRHFTPHDRQLVARATRGIKWFHRQVLLSHGLGISAKALNPTERRVLNALLTARTEKQIAADLGMTAGTTHQYATAIYRKFSVRGRAGLMALWLSGDL